MRFSAAVASVILTLTSFGPVSAAPAPAADQAFLEPTPTDDFGSRSCQTIYPSFIKPIFSMYPDYSAPNTMLQDRSFQVQSGDSWRQDSLVMFTGIPSGANGCQLQYTFPSGFTLTLVGHTQLYVYTMDRNATDSDTWENSPKEKSLWGSANPAPGGSGVVNSETCYESLTYRIEIGDQPNSGL
ncbi:MAG: hypothetical protein M1839_002255, partial [Geoglossum umbratile]